MSRLLERHEVLASTQDRAHELALAGAAEGTAVVTARQTSGRGTRGRRWDSSPGGLWLSVIGRPPEADPLERLSVRVGLLAAAAIERVADLPADRIQLKWPNDLLLSGRKLGGILSEARWHGEQPAWVVVGVGINVRNQLPAEPLQPAARLAELDETLQPEALVEPVVAAVVDALGRRGELTQGELAGFARRDWLAGRRVATPVSGTILGLRPDGRLAVERDDGSVVAGSLNLSWSDLAPEPGSR